MLVLLPESHLLIQFCYCFPELPPRVVRRHTGDLL
jgi:hypothetical protein